MKVVTLSSKRKANNHVEPSRLHLLAAAKIVETVAYEIARSESAKTIEDLMGLARGLETVAYRLGVES